MGVDRYGVAGAVLLQLIMMIYSNRQWALLIDDVRMLEMVGLVGRLLSSCSKNKSFVGFVVASSVGRSRQIFTSILLIGFHDDDKDPSKIHKRPLP